MWLHRFSFTALNLLFILYQELSHLASVSLQNSSEPPTILSLLTYCYLTLKSLGER